MYNTRRVLGVLFACLGEEQNTSFLRTRKRPSAAAGAAAPCLFNCCLIVYHAAMLVSYYCGKRCCCWILMMPLPRGAAGFFVTSGSRGTFGDVIIMPVRESERARRREAFAVWEESFFFCRPFFCFFLALFFLEKCTLRIRSSIFCRL